MFPGPSVTLCLCGKQLRELAAILVKQLCHRGPETQRAFVRARLCRAIYHYCILGVGHVSIESFECVGDVDAA